jgi:hypothetical protein
MWRKDVSSPLSLSLAMHFIFAQVQLGVKSPDFGSVMRFARPVAETGGVRGVTLGGAEAPYGPSPKERTPSAESLRERKGSGGPKAASSKRGGGESGGEPPVAHARHRAGIREPVS